MVRVNLLGDYLEPPSLEFPLRDFLLVGGVWLLAMGAFAALLFR